MYRTTLNRIREQCPDNKMWDYLLASLGKTHADDEPLSLLHIVDSNGIEDAIWALRAIDDCSEIRLFAVRCARQIQHLMTDERSINTLNVAELTAIGEATAEELEEARHAAWGVVNTAESNIAGWAASTAAWCATWCAGRAAVDAARTAVLATDNDMWETIHNDYIAIFCQK